MEIILKSIHDNVMDGKRADVEAQVQRALEAEIPVDHILNQGLIQAMEEVGKRFEAGEFFIPEMLISARAMQSGLAVLKPHLVEENVQTKGIVVVGTVKGDMHDIGKNLVAMMLEGAGFEVTDLGTDVLPEKFVSVVREKKPYLIGLSALLTTTMQNMKVTIDALNQAGVRQQVKVIVGGAPVTEAYAQSIGADGYAPDASRAVSLAKSLA